MVMLYGGNQVVQLECDAQWSRVTRSATAIAADQINGSKFAHPPVIGLLWIVHQVKIEDRGLTASPMEPF